MLAHLVIALLQVTTPPAPQKTGVTPPPQVQRDSSRYVRRPRKEPKRAELTPELLATAFKDSSARSLLLLARGARMRQDDALGSYDATTYQRVSAGIGFSKIGRDRLAFRSEQATKVRWRKGTGAYVDITGSRAVVPIAGKSTMVRLSSDITPVPYFPGAETLWIGSEAAGSVNEEDGIIHPLAEGSEAYYTYIAGDSATFRLPDGKAIRLRELQVRPRTPRWNLAVGSLWFDLSGGQLVRAAYRMSVPMDIKAVAEEDDSTSFEDVPAMVKPLIFPMTASVSAIGVEYGLYEGRFWLPRVQVMEGSAQVSFVKSPFKLEQKFEYENVNSGAALPAIPNPVAGDRRGGGGVNVDVRVGGQADRQTAREARRARGRRAQCDTSSSGNSTFIRETRDGVNPVFVSVPCDSTKLANSPDLPPSIYDKGEEVFSSPEMDELVQQALSMGAQSQFAPAPIKAEWLNPRYNRIEGVSLGGRADQELGNGYSLHGTARIGIADFEPNVELGVARSDLRRTLTLTGYNHLVSASDWGNPLSLGASISAFLFGRDEGFYYRSSGLELTSAPAAAVGGSFTWSAFAEHQRTARQKTTFSVARSVHGSQFEPNFAAHRALYAGARTRYAASYGLDPQGFRLFSDFRMEAAAADTGAFGRAAIDVTASHGIGDAAVGLTLAGGSTVGTVPLQRYWYLGGTQTVRGIRPGTQSGNAFWLARAELALNASVVRPTVFADMGWAGSRDNFRNIGVPMSGAGVGWSIMDGLIRFDVARGINPTPGWRVDTYVEARF